MNDFKRHSAPYPGGPLPVDWHDNAERINNMPTKGSEEDWLFPTERFNKLLAVNLPKREELNFSTLMVKNINREASSIDCQISNFFRDIFWGTAPNKNFKKTNSPPPKIIFI